MASDAPRPLKRLGQHFLIDGNIAKKIVALAELGPAETVLEVGPGRGALTRLLSERAARVIAVELDTRLAPHLQTALADRNNVELRFEDALAFPYESLPAGTVVVGNLPYYVSSPLLFKLLEARQVLSRMVLMLQTEMACRLVASPGSRDYGTPSVLTSYWAEARLAFQVSRNCFRPRPEVDSSVVILKIRQQPCVPVLDEPTLVRTVRASFAHRRKTVSNSLRDEGLSSAAIGQALKDAGIDPVRRAETLTLQEFAAIANALVEAQDKGQREMGKG